MPSRMQILGCVLEPHIWKQVAARGWQIDTVLALLLPGCLHVWLAN